MSDDVPLQRQQSAAESVIFTRRSMMGISACDRLITSPSRLFIVHTLRDARYGSEAVIEAGLDAAIWMVDAITALLPPLSQGGTASDTFRIDRTSGDKLSIRRTASVEGEGDTGFTLMDKGSAPGLGGFPSIAWSDRLLFDGGLFAALRQLGQTWALAHGQPGPRQEAYTIRPNWMGKTPAETPPPSPDPDPDERR